jgi:hypothetical protein
MNLNPVGWASAALRLLARLDSDGVNSTTPVTEINGGTISATNADIALVAKGTGATLAQVPDGTLLGGNKRGAGATDWQKSRNGIAQVASGTQATIGGGNANTVSSTYGTIAGGSGNTVQGSWGTVGGGDSNTASSSYTFVGGGGVNTAQTNTYATVCGGSTNTASGQYSFVGGGTTNTANGTYAFVGGGGSNIASSSYSSVLGGVANTANAERSCVVGGAYGTTRAIRGLAVFPSCASPIDTTAGVTQSALLLLGRQTTDATATVLTSNTTAAGTTNQVILPNNSAYSFSGEVIAGVTGAGNTARWTIDGAIKRGANAASTAMVGTATVTMTHNDAGAATWVVAVTADTTNGGIAVTVTGAAATTIRWVCKINTTEMTY